jgi:hypothetical protein
MKENTPYWPMTPKELSQIGEELYGKWGWKRKLASALEKNENTIGRWTSGKSPIEPSEAMAIRSLRDSFQMQKSKDFVKGQLRALASLSFPEELSFKPSRITFGISDNYRDLLLLMLPTSVWCSKYKGKIEITGSVENGIEAYFTSPMHFDILLKEVNDFQGLSAIINLP